MVSMFGWIGKAFSREPVREEVGKAAITVTLRDGRTLKYELVGTAETNDVGWLLVKSAQLLYETWPAKRMEGPLFRISETQWIPSSDITDITAEFTSHLVVPD